MSTASPYRVLARLGLHPGVSTRQMQAANESASLAEWEVLQKFADPEQRLAADFYLYHVAASKAWSQILICLMDGEELDEAEARRVLTSDAALLFLLQGHRETALTWMEARFRSNRFDTRAAHDLTIYYHTEAHYWEASGQPDRAEAAWRRAIAYFCRTLADEAYWLEWTAGRQQVHCPHGPPPVPAARLELVRSRFFAVWQDHFQRRGEQLRQAGDLHYAAAFGELAMLLRIEWRAALTVRQASRIFVEAFPFGPLLAAAAGLDRLLPDILSACREAGVEAGKLGLAIRLRFSSLALAAALLDEGRAEEAFKEIEERSGVFDPVRDGIYASDPDGAKDFARDAARLGVQALLARAGAVPLPGGEPALRAALDAAAKFARERQCLPEVVRAMTSFAIDRSRSYSSQEARDAEGIENVACAILVLESIFAVLGADRCPAELGQELAQSLQCRGVLLQRAGHHSLSYRDLRRAWMLHPDKSGILRDLCRTLFNWAGDLREAGEYAAARGKVEEALRLLRDTDNPECLSVRDILYTELDILDGKDPAEKYFDQLDQVLWGQSEGVVGEGEAGIRTAEARIAAGDPLGAAGALRQAFLPALRNQALWDRIEPVILAMFVSGGRDLAMELICQHAAEAAGHAGFRRLEAAVRLAADLIEEGSKI